MCDGAHNPFAGDIEMFVTELKSSDEAIIAAKKEK